jgi:hypothetical protein
MKQNYPGGITMSVARKSRRRRPSISTKPKKVRRSSKEPKIRLSPKQQEYMEMLALLKKPKLSDFVLPKHGFMIVGPKEARKLLKKARKNRPIRMGHVKYLAQRMRNGEWFICDPLAFDDEGYLIGGSHRLKAVILFGGYVVFPTMHGVADGFRDASNTQSGTKLGSELRKNGFTNYNQKSSAVNLAVELLAGKKVVPIKEAPEYAEWAKVFKGISPVVDRVVKSKGGWRKAAIIGALVYAYNTNPEAVMSFTEKLVTGAGLKATEPVYVLREWYLAYVQSKVHGKAGGGDERVVVYTHRVLIALHAQLERKKVTSLETITKTAGVEAVEYFKEANQTRKAKQLIAPWIQQRLTYEAAEEALKVG